ncbi:MAG: 30S ribosomal protein S2 [Bacteroidales bacterium]|jgi:small subunit ribosomal protein S2|nr:30S ribosomal protein S2 [Bacteroidales bacterium]
MSVVTFDELLNSGVHFGHLKRKWNPKMSQYIFSEKNGIHIINLNKTVEKLDEACAAAKQIAKSGKLILFVATKKQARTIIAEQAQRVGMPYVSERWPGGMLTNFATIRKAVKKMATIDELMNDKQFEAISKRERLQIQREKEKLERNLGSIASLQRLPSAVFIVDINKEHIAVDEARRLNLPTFAITDTNTNPELINFPIPANDDASKSIEIIVSKIADAIEEGLRERKIEKDARKDEEEVEGTKAKADIEDEDDDEAGAGREKRGKRRGEDNGDDRGNRNKRPRRSPAGNAGKGGGQRR